MGPVSEVWGGDSGDSRGQRGHTHLPLLAADLAQPDGLGPVVGALHPALGAHVLRAKNKEQGDTGATRNVPNAGRVGTASPASPPATPGMPGTQNPRCPRGGGWFAGLGAGSHLLAVLADDTGGAPCPQLLPAEDAAVHAVPQHAAAHVLQPGHQAPGERAQECQEKALGMPGKEQDTREGCCSPGAAAAFGPDVPLPGVAPHGASPSPAMGQNHIPAGNKTPTGL